jgi:hypothetical protein
VWILEVVAESDDGPCTCKKETLTWADSYLPLLTSPNDSSSVSPKGEQRCQTNKKGQASSMVAASLKAIGYSALLRPSMFGTPVPCKWLLRLVDLNHQPRSEAQVPSTNPRSIPNTLKEIWYSGTRGSGIACGVLQVDPVDALQQQLSLMSDRYPRTKEFPGKLLEGSTNWKHVA